MTMAREVRRTESKIVAVSSGTMVRGSITSAEMPSPSRISAAFLATCTMEEVATSVMSRPSRRMAACPMR